MTNPKTATPDSPLGGGLVFPLVTSSKGSLPVTVKPEQFNMLSGLAEEALQARARKRREQVLTAAVAAGKIASAAVGEWRARYNDAPRATAEQLEQRSPTSPADVAADRDALIDQAIADGKILASSRDEYVAAFDANPLTTAELIEKLAPTEGLNDETPSDTVPHAEIMARAFGVPATEQRPMTTHEQTMHGFGLRGRS